MNCSTREGCKRVCMCTFMLPPQLARGPHFFSPRRNRPSTKWSTLRVLFVKPWPGFHFPRESPSTWARCCVSQPSSARADQTKPFEHDRGFVHPFNQSPVPADFLRLRGTGASVRCLDLPAEASQRGVRVGKGATQRTSPGLRHA